MPISMRFPHAHLLPHLRTEALPHQSCIAYVLVGLQLTGIHRFYTQYRANSRLFLSPSTHQALKLEVWGTDGHKEIEKVEFVAHAAAPKCRPQVRKAQLGDIAGSAFVSGPLSTEFKPHSPRGFCCWLLGMVEGRGKRRRDHMLRLRAVFVHVYAEIRLRFSTDFLYP